MKWTAVALALNACALAQPVPPGPGEVSQSSRERLGQQRKESLLDTTRRACEWANQHRDDLRAQRKAAELARTALDSLSGDRQAAAAPSNVLGWCRPVAERLSADPCGTGVEAAAVFRSAADHEEAARGFAQVARECRNSEAAVDGLYELHQLLRCQEGIALVAAAWAGSPQESWVHQFDAISRCSDSVTLRRNLSFVPEEVREDYFALLERRRQQAEREAREAAAREAARARQSACESDCFQFSSQCRSSCTTSPCYSNCDAMGSACRSGCH